MNDNVIELFKKTVPECESPEETVRKFHEKLEEVQDAWPTLGVMDKLEVFTSVCEMNKSILTLYFDLKRRHEHTINN